MQEQVKLGTVRRVRACVRAAVRMQQQQEVGGGVCRTHPAKIDEPSRQLTRSAHRNEMPLRRTVVLDILTSSSRWHAASRPPSAITNSVVAWRRCFSTAPYGTPSSLRKYLNRRLAGSYSNKPGTSMASPGSTRTSDSPGACLAFFLSTRASSATSRAMSSCPACSSTCMRLTGCP
jgi:hypothetical protein